MYSPAGIELFNLEYYQGGDVAVKYYHERGHFVSNTSCANSATYVKKLETITTTKGTRYIKNINSPQGQIHFTYGNGERMDLINAWNLKEIALINNSAVTVRKFVFEHDHFTGQKARSYHEFPDNFNIVKSCDTPGSGNCRLRLDRIIENSNGLSKLYRAFNYNLEEDLPSREQVFEDHWGYYNSRRSSMYPNQPFHYPGYSSRMPTIYSGTGSVLYSGALKTPHYASTAANVLEEIEYPTGGLTRFVYEGNTTATMGDKGGLRVKEIVNITDGTEVGKRTFEYEVGTSFNTPVYSYNMNRSQISNSFTWSFLIVSWTVSEDCDTEVVLASSSSFQSLFDLSEYSVGYGKVTERFSNGGYVVREYSNFNDHPDDAPINFLVPELLNIGNQWNGPAKTSAFLLDNNNYSYNNVESSITNSWDYPTNISEIGSPFTNTTSRFWERGNLLEQRFYDASDKKIRELINQYDFSLPVKGSNTGVVTSVLATSSNGITNYAIGSYLVMSQPIVLKKVISNSFDQLDPTKRVSSITEYEYDADHIQLSKEMSHNFNETKKYIKEYRYAQDLTNTPNNPPSVANITNGADGVWSMIQRNIYLPIETIDWLDDGTNIYLLGANIQTYKKNLNATGAPLNPFNNYNLSINATSLSYTYSDLTSSETQYTYDSRFLKNHSYDLYDANNNLTKETVKDGTVKTYEWGYNNSLLTASIVNPGTNEQRTTYIHKQLVGVTQVTDANLEKTKYEYDDFNRLSIIRDDDNNILQRYRYHYKNQVENLSATFDYSGINKINTSLYFVADDNNGLIGKTKYLWDYGDGTTEESDYYYQYHSYTNAGTYTAKLTVINPDYEPVQYTKAITIYENLFSVTISNVGSNQVDICSETAAKFGLVKKKGANCGAPYSYDFEYKLNNASSWSTFTTDLPALLPNKPLGIYNIRCTVVDDCGNAYESNQINVTFIESAANCGVQ